MPSPFPGMDPFIEANDRWPDFHMTFMTTCREQLLTRLPANYDARLEERMQLIDQGDRSTQTYRPDVAVLRANRTSDAGGGVAVLTELEPVTLHNVEVETDSIGYIEIRTISDAQLVTVIEVLSPKNKREPGHSEYRAKMENFRRNGIHVVEIDLLLAGERLKMVEPLPPGDYFTALSRREQYPECEVYAWSIRRKLPTIPIPLVSPDVDAPLNLAEAFATTFERGGYSRSLNYGQPLSSELSIADREWATGLVKTALK